MDQHLDLDLPGNLKRVNSVLPSSKRTGKVTEQ